MTTAEPNETNARKTPYWLKVALVVAVLSAVACLVVAVFLALRKPPPASTGSDAGPLARSTVAPVVVTAVPFIITGRETNIYMEYIMDASGSMMELLPDGTLKRDVATEVLTARLNSFPPEINIGLRAYGHRLDWEGQVEESCRDIELIAPVETGQLERIASWLQEFPAKGMTPLAESIRQAIEDFIIDPSRVNTIVLISDGNETCEGDPCALVEELKLEGINFKLHVIGLNVDAETRTQLECIAGAGEGLYRDVRSAKELNQALDEIEKQVAEDQKEINPTETPTPTTTSTPEPPTHTSTAPPPTDTSTPEPPTTTHTPKPPTLTSTPRPPTTTPTPRPPTTTPTPQAPTYTPTPKPPTYTPTPQITRTPTPAPPTPTPTIGGCTRPNITDFKAVPPTQGTTARFSLEWTIQGADRAEIFGNPVDPTSGRFDVWDDETNYWVLWAKVAGTPDDCYAEWAIQVDPDTISPSGPGLEDVTVSQRDVTISVRDHAAVDGDRIDLFVNGAKVISNYTLTSSPHGVSVKLNSGENTVQVTALNEGSASPNTVEVSVNHVSDGYSVQVSTGLHTGQSESFKIHAP